MENDVAGNSCQARLEEVDAVQLSRLILNRKHNFKAVDHISGSTT